MPAGMFDANTAELDVMKRIAAAAGLTAVLLVSATACSAHPSRPAPAAVPIDQATIAAETDALLRETVDALMSLDLHAEISSGPKDMKQRGFEFVEGQCRYSTGVARVSFVFSRTDMNQVLTAVDPVLERHGFPSAEEESGAQRWSGIRAEAANGSVIYLHGRGDNDAEAYSGSVPGIDDESSCLALNATP